MTGRDCASFMIDNYDSFTYNLVQYLGELGADIDVVRNDAVIRRRARGARRPTHLVVSPGPCTPDEAGVSVEAIAHARRGGTPVLGVCLGHQAHRPRSTAASCARERACTARPRSQHDGTGVFAGLPEPVRGGALPLAGGGPDAARLPGASAPGAGRRS